MYESIFHFFLCSDLKNFLSIEQLSDPTNEVVESVGNLNIEQER